MNTEVLKTFILTILVASSFLLSFIIWSYQPQYEMYSKTDYINEVEIGGKEESKKDLIKPSQIVFHNQDEGILGFDKASQEYNFYQEISSWDLQDLELFNEKKDKKELIKDKSYVEVIFPSEESLELIENIFEIEEDYKLPNWLFDRFIIIDNGESDVSIHIYSTDTDSKLEVKVNETKAAKFLETYDKNHSDLDSFVKIPFIKKATYIPKEVGNISKKTLVANQIDSSLFINVLFPNPSLVKPHQKEPFYTDGQRGMRVFQGGGYLEFIHPLEGEKEILDTNDLLERSVSDINLYKGWINDYYLESINPRSGQLVYRLHYEDLPVYDFNNLSILDQVWKGEDLYQYRRSLLQTSHLLNAEEMEVPTSEDIFFELEESKKYSTEKIDDIRLGYYLSYQNEIHSLTLEPMWFILYENSWERLVFDKNNSISDE